MSKITFIDIGVPLEPSASEPLPLEVVHEDHSQNAARTAMFFGAKETDLPDGMGWAVDQVKMNTHSGPHVDAPWHYFPTSEGAKARTIDEMPLDWFYGNSVVLDFRYKPAGSQVSADEVKQALEKIKYKLKPRDIVLIQTGADKTWGTDEYVRAGCGMGREATLWLIEQGVKVMGIDAWGWDRPFWAIKEEFKRTGNRNMLWEGHRAGIEKEYCHIEKLANLDKLPRPFGFEVACFPIKVTGGSAGWCRPVAIFRD
jgi:kynurenine formamidase